MDLHVHLDGAGTLQTQLLRALRAALLEGRIAIDAALPPTRQLARYLGVSRNTVLWAYEQLLAEGLIRGRRGAGYFVLSTGVRGAPPAQAVSCQPQVSAFAQRLSEIERCSSILPRRFDLRTGIPVVSPALHSAWRRALIRAADDTAFDYPPAAGLTALRVALAGYLARRRGISVDPEHLLIVTGIQQGIDLAARVLLDAGDLAVVEEPCYGGLQHAFSAHGARLIRVAVDRHGLCVDELSHQGVRLVAVTPSHQFPTGVELSLARRIALLQWAKLHQAWVLEDDYDGEFRHGGRPLPAMKSLDRDERVIYLGSLSRVLFPAVRLGYMVVPAGLARYFTRAKRLADRGTPAIEQRALADLISSGRFERLLLASARQLDQRRRVVLAALQQHLGESIEILGAAAGMHLCLRIAFLRADQEQQLIDAAAAVDLNIEGISGYFERPSQDLYLLLSYAQLAPDDLREAIARLAGVLREVGHP